MRTIYKYRISYVSVIEMPKGAKVVKVGIQKSVGLYLWAEVETTYELEKRRFVIVGTGHEIPLLAKYVGTFFDHPYVWHVYELDSSGGSGHE